MEDRGREGIAAEKGRDSEKACWWVIEGGICGRMRWLGDESRYLEVNEPLTGGLLSGFSCLVSGCCVLLSDRERRKNWRSLMN